MHGFIVILRVLVPVLVAMGGHSAQAGCVAARGAPALDHVILAVRDLDHASGAFAAHGFRLKAGRLHANGLLNRHVKFRDGTSLELMTVQGQPGDALAANYARILADGELGAYVGLTIENLAVAESAAARAAGSRARVLGVVLHGAVARDTVVEPHPALWVRAESAPRRD